jgi:adenine phosphoribosyltransferase
MSLYIPRGIIKRGDSVLIVDDLIKTGETQRVMAKMITKSRAEVAGIYALIAIGDQWKKRLGSITTSPIEVVLTVKSIKKRY